MYARQPVAEWQATLASLDLPRYEVTFSAIITTLATLLLPTGLVEPLIAALLDLFSIGDTFSRFIKEVYYPRVSGDTLSYYMTIL
jgi:hypothetical protein